MEDQDDKIHVMLLMAKTRVAPLETLTVPWLELQAAVEAFRLSTVIRPIDGGYFWSNTRIALVYIKNSEPDYHMFVVDRVQEIRQSSDPAQWYHKPG